ncbi:MAG: hypothetical protein IPK60_11830 [Sandaracinaceae bacterium]|nr:hypothetical protein [Sandaracinaceae bacterium]
MKNPSLFVLVAALLVGGPACSDENTPPGNDAGALRDAGASDANLFDAGMSDASAMDAAADAGAEDAAAVDLSEFDSGAMERHLPRGSVTVRSSHHGAVQEGFASASFIAALPDGACVVSHPSDACEYLSCPSLETTPADSGDITVSGIASPLLLFPNVEHIYNIFRATTALWEGGETITISSVGNDDVGQVPPFSTALAAPSEVMITMPALSSSAAVIINRAEDFHVAWTGSSAGELVVEIANVDTGIQSLNCRFPVIAGSATVPAAALSSLAATTSATLQIRTEDSDLLFVDDWEIRVVTRTLGYGADDTIAAQTAQIN